MKRISIFAIVILAFVAFALRAGPILKFNRIGVEQGLPDRTVWDIKQSSDGLIWLGTSRGLISFDGYEFKEYRSFQASEKSLESNVIRSIYVDEKDQILVGTYAGLLQLDQNTNSLKPINLALLNNNSLSDTTIYTVLISNKQQVWLGTDKGLITLNKEFNQVLAQPGSTNFENHPSGRVISLIETDNQDILVGTVNGLFLLKSNQKKFDSISYHTPDITELRIQSLFKRNKGSILAGTNQGLYEVDIKNNKMLQVLPELTEKYIYSIEESSENELWIGTQDDGLYSLDEKNKLHHSRYSSDNSDGLSDNDVYSLLIDHTGVLWTGSFNAGINRIDPRSRRFQFFNDKIDSLSCLKSPVVYAIYQQSHNIFWLGTQKGLARVEQNLNQCDLFTTTTNNKGISLSGQDVLALFPDKKHKNRLHVATRKGIDTIDLNQLENINIPELKSIRSAEDYLFLDNNSQYIASYFGLFRKENEQEAFTKVKGINDTIENSIFFQVVAANNQVFLASWSGLLTINKEGIVEPIGWNNASHLKNPIRSLIVDSKNRLWIGIDNIGLFCYTSNGELLFEFTDSNKFAAIHGFSSIVEVNNGDLWIASTNGISHLNSISHEIVNYHSSDGLASETYTNGAFLKASDGTIYFGNRKGLTKFKPDLIKKDDTLPKVALTKFLYFNQVLDHNSDSEGFSLSAPLSQLEQLNLSHKDYVFGFEFAALHYSAPKRNQYAYKMENWDEKWNYTKADFRRANYSNLPPGNYTFKVKASNHHGVWNEVPLELPIQISPPWWKTNLAYFSYAVMFVLMLYSFIAFRTQALRKRAKQLEQSVEQRTSELAQEKHKVEQLLSRKNEEFANVSHEFRTPLTLILGPIAQLLRIQRDDNELQKLNIVQRNGYRLLRMVDQLLNMETFRVKAITQKAPQAIGKTIQMIAEAFKDLADEKHVTLNIHAIEEINFEFTPDAIDKIILNLLSNALKYTHSGGSIDISGGRTGESFYQILIEDTGIGIPADKLNTVFERFNRVLDEKSEQVTGAGIGLALVKSLIESHKGKIKLTSEVGKGTKVTVTLPIINEVSDFELTPYANDEIIAMEMMSLTSQVISEGPDNTSNLVVEDSNKPTVLVIEDNEDMRNYIGNSISDDYKILMAQDGQQGFDLAKQEVPDLIVSDIMMPKMDGYQATRELRKNEITSHIPIILLTARGDRESRLKGWYEKADEYLTKPFDVEELKIRLNNLLEIRDILKKRFSESLFQPVDNIEEEHVEDLDQNKNKQQQVFIDRVNTTLEKLYSEPATTIDDIADSLAISKRQLFRKINSIMDMTPADYLRRYRLEKAKQILHEGRSAGFAALDAGFSSQSYFGKCFKAQYGKTPGEYQKSL